MWQRRNVSHGFISLCLVLLVPPAAYVAPEWWRKGWARGRVDSVAEAELLSQLAAILMPNLEIQELFRSFPSPDGWGGHALEPDLAAFGILKEKDAALFVEYDGFWRHQEKKGMVMDRRKNAALLTYAPKGSFVVRISHTQRRPLKENVLWVKVDTWRQGHGTSLLETLKSALMQISAGLVDVLRPCAMKQVRGKINQELWTLSESGWHFAKEAIDQIHGSSSEELICFLRAEGFSAQSIEAMKLRTWFCGQNIEGSLKPKFRWIVDLGLSKSQVAKAVATFCPVLGLSIEQNLKPTVQWLLDLGLTKRQVAKAVATFPPVLGLSIEQNLKPTVQWLLDLGLTKSQVAKAVATNCCILGYSVQQNLKPTVQWLLDLGLTKSQVAKAVATHSGILCYSVQQNLKPSVDSGCWTWVWPRVKLQRQWPLFLQSSALALNRTWNPLCSGCWTWVWPRGKLQRQWPLVLKFLAIASSRTWNPLCSGCWTWVWPRGKLQKQWPLFLQSSALALNRTWNPLCSGCWTWVWPRGKLQRQWPLVLKFLAIASSRTWNPLCSGCWTWVWPRAKLRRQWQLTLAFLAIASSRTWNPLCSGCWTCVWPRVKLQRQWLLSRKYCAAVSGPIWILRFDGLWRWVSTRHKLPKQWHLLLRCWDWV